MLQASLDLQVQQASELHFWINLMTCPFSDPHWCTGRGLKYQVEKKNSLQVNHRQTLYNLFGSSYGPDGTPGVGGAGLGLGAFFSADFQRRKPASSMTQLRSTLMYRRKRPQISHRLLALIGDSTPLPSLILWEFHKLPCHYAVLENFEFQVNTKTSPMFVISFCHCDSLRARWNPWCSRQHRTRWSRP